MIASIDVYGVVVFAVKGSRDFRERCHGVVEGLALLLNHVMQLDPLSIGSEGGVPILHQLKIGQAGVRIDVVGIDQVVGEATFNAA